MSTSSEYSISPEYWICHVVSGGRVAEDEIRGADAAGWVEIVVSGVHEVDSRINGINNQFRILISGSFLVDLEVVDGSIFVM
jgi:hypothetical protein